MKTPLDQRAILAKGVYVRAMAPSFKHGPLGSLGAAGVSGAAPGSTSKRREAGFCRGGGTSMQAGPAVPADAPRLIQIWLDASRVGHPFLGEETLREQRRPQRIAGFERGRVLSRLVDASATGASPLGRPRGGLLRFNRAWRSAHGPSPAGHPGEKGLPWPALCERESLARSCSTGRPRRSGRRADRP